MVTGDGGSSGQAPGGLPARLPSTHPSISSWPRVYFHGHMDNGQFTYTSSSASLYSFEVTFWADTALFASAGMLPSETGNSSR